MVGRLEQFKNILIPIDDVRYAEYIPENKDKMISGNTDDVTIIYIQSKSSFSMYPIQIKGNVLTEFSDWIRQFYEMPEIHFKCNNEIIDVENEGYNPLKDWIPSIRPLKHNN